MIQCKKNKDHNQPLISIITVVYNAIEDLRLTVQSVMAQQYWPNFEYIIVDGASTDSTLEYLKSLPSTIRCISEPDQGIYDAMNKGLKLAKGKGLLFLNAGDYFVGQVIDSTLYVPSFLPVMYKHPVFGLRPIKLRSRKQGLPNCHQGIVFENRKDIYYDLQYKLCADYDFYLKHSYGDRLPIHQCSGYVYYDNTGLSKQQSKKRDLEIASIIGKNFSWYSVVWFKTKSVLKRLVRICIEKF